MNKILLILAGMLLPALGFAQGNGNYQQTSLGSSGHTLVGTTVNGCSTRAVGYPCALVDSRWAAPSLNVDATHYGVRAVSPFVAPAIAGITASINSSSSTASLSAASTFQNGDGVVIYGAGATNTMSTPAAPTVTPSVAAAYTGSLLDVAAPAGGTQYCYQVVARDVMGGLTAASTETCTATGAATLGSVTNSVSTITMSGVTVTVTTTAPHGLAVGAMFNMAGVTVNGSTANAFNGWFIVTSSSGNTNFTYQTLSDTKAGAPSSGTSGTVTYWQNNHIVATATTGSFQYYVYGRVTGGSKTLIGVMLPQFTGLAGDTTYLAFDDFGSTVSTRPALPSYVPTNPPGAATNDMLVTTIVSGGGTTTLTLAGTASQTVTGATILFDDALNFFTAATAAKAAGAAVLLPVGTANYFIFNSPVTLPSQVAVEQKGPVFINETLNTNGAVWSGVIEYGSLPSFALFPHPAITFANAQPGMYSTSPFKFFNITFAHNGNNGSTMLVTDGTGGNGENQFRGVNFVLNGGGITDYTNTAITIRGTHSGGYGTRCATLNDVLFLTSQNGNLLANAPAMYAMNCGGISFQNLALSGKGILLRPAAAGSSLEADNVYSQGSYEPFFAFTNASGNGNATITTKITNGVPDTSFAPMVVNLGGGPTANVTLRIQIEMTQASSNLVTGIPVTSVVAINSFPFTQNTSLETSATSTLVIDGTFGSTYMAMKNLNASMNLGLGYSLFTNTTNPAAPTCTVGGGGSVPADTWSYFYIPVWQNGSEGVRSLSCTAVTTTVGNQQTVSLSWSAVSGAKGYDVYRTNGGGAVMVNGPGCSVPQFTGTTYVDTFGATCAIPASASASGGPAGITKDTVWANNLTLGPSAAPTGATNLTKLYMDSTLKWPSFKPNGNTGYALLGFNGGISPSVQTKRVTGCATIASMNATCDTTVTWPNAFGDTSYTAVCSGEGVSSGVPIIQGIDILSAKTTSYISVRTLAITAAAAHFTTIDCTAVHD